MDPCAKTLKNHCTRLEIKQTEVGETVHNSYVDKGTCHYMEHSCWCCVASGSGGPEHGYCETGEKARLLHPLLLLQEWMSMMLGFGWKVTSPITNRISTQQTQVVSWGSQGMVWGHKIQSSRWSTAGLVSDHPEAPHTPFWVPGWKKKTGPDFNGIQERS